MGKKGLGTLFGFSDSTVNLAVGIVLILASLIPNIIEDISNVSRIRRQHVEVAKN